MSDFQSDIQLFFGKSCVLKPYPDEKALLQTDRPLSLTRVPIYRHFPLAFFGGLLYNELS